MRVVKDIHGMKNFKRILATVYNVKILGITEQKLEKAELNIWKPQ